MIPAWPLTLVLIVGAFVIGVCFGVVIERDRKPRRALRFLTAEARDESRRFARAVGASVRTPVPFRRLRTKGVA
jgi:hypothetical protein